MKYRLKDNPLLNRLRQIVPCDMCGRWIWRNGVHWYDSKWRIHIDLHERCVGRFKEQTATTPQTGSNR